MNSKLPKWTISPREKPPQVRYSPSVVTVRLDEWTIRTFREKHATNLPSWRTNSRYFLHQQITESKRSCDSSFELVSWTNEYTRVYPGSNPSHQDLWCKVLTGYSRVVTGHLTVLKLAIGSNKFVTAVIILSHLYTQLKSTSKTWSIKAQ
jgi:hypothetical protein